MWIVYSILPTFRFFFFFSVFSRLKYRPFFHILWRTQLVREHEWNVNRNTCKWWINLFSQWNLKKKKKNEYALSFCSARTRDATLWNGSFFLNLHFRANFGHFKCPLFLPSVDGFQRIAQEGGQSDQTAGKVERIIVVLGGVVQGAGNWTAERGGQTLHQHQYAEGVCEFLNAQQLDHNDWS